MTEVMTKEDLLKREIVELQKSVHDMLMRHKELADTVFNLKCMVKNLGGDPNQLELKI